MLNVHESIRRGYVRAFCLVGLAALLAAAIGAGFVVWADTYHAGAAPTATLLAPSEQGEAGVTWRFTARDRQQALLMLAGELAWQENVHRITIDDEIQGKNTWTLIVRVEE